MGKEKCPKVCHDEKKCGKCKRDKGCDCKRKYKKRVKVVRPCELPCKVKDQIKFLEVRNKHYCPCGYQCLPKIYDPAKMYEKCYFNCCNECKECKKQSDDCSCSSSSSSSSSSSTSCECKKIHGHKDCSSSSSSSSSSDSTTHHKKKKKSSCGCGR